MRQGVSLSPRDPGLTAKPLSVDAPTPTRIMDAKQFPPLSSQHCDERAVLMVQRTSGPRPIPIDMAFAKPTGKAALA
jgi:hypothetical protein